MKLFGPLLALFIVFLLLLDYARFGRNMRRVFWLELILFCAGAVFVLMPEWAQALANLFGVGRGVDFIVYPLLIWLVHESIVSRYNRWEDGLQRADLVRQLALDNARRAKPE